MARLLRPMELLARLHPGHRLMGIMPCAWPARVAIAATDHHLSYAEPLGLRNAMSAPEMVALLLEEMRREV